LRKTATSADKAAPPFEQCPKTYVGVIDGEKGYGRTGNHLIAFAHMLWYASKAKHTVVVPLYMFPIIRHFHLDVLRNVACFDLNTPRDMFREPLHANAYALCHKSVDFYHIETLVGLARERKVQVPTGREELDRDLEEFVSRVFLALWSRPREPLFDYAFHVVSEHLGGSVRYVAVHKRGFERGCADHMNSTGLLAMKDEELLLPVRSFAAAHPVPADQAALRHPLCDLNDSFVRMAMAMHRRENEPVYVATDGQEKSDIEGVFLKQVGAALLTVCVVVVAARSIPVVPSVPTLTSNPAAYLLCSTLSDCVCLLYAVLSL
jgi:hypothetical protein